MALVKYTNRNLERRDCLDWNKTTWLELNKKQHEYFKMIKYALDIAIYSCASAINKLLEN